MHLREIVYYKAFCILAVVFIHASSSATAVDTSGYIDNGIDYLNHALQWAVPAFIMVSAFLHVYLYRSKTVTTMQWVVFFRKRFLTIIIPYLVFSVLYYIYREWDTNQVSGIAENTVALLTKLITGKAYFHLYFVIIIVNFYLLFPLLHAALRKFPVIGRHSLLIGLIIHSLVIFSNQAWQWRDSDSILLIFALKLLPYLVYVFLGTWIGLHYERLRDWFQHPFSSVRAGTSSTILIIWSVSFAFWFVVSDKNTANAWSETIRLLYIYPTTVLILIGSFAMFGKQDTHWNRWMYRIGDRSFGIYLIHPFILIIMRQWLPMPEQPWLAIVWVCACFLLSLLATNLIVWLLHKYAPWHPYVIGNLNKS